MADGPPDSHLPEDALGPLLAPPEEAGLAPESIPDDAQHATITGCQLHRFADGRISFLVSIASRDIQRVAQLELPIPTGFEEGLAFGADFDPLTLPEDDEGGRQQSMFRRSIANRKRDAWLQRLVFNSNSIARESGRDPAALGIPSTKPTDLEDYTARLHVMLEGVDCILLRRGGRVWDILPDDNPHPSDHRLKGYKRLWDKEER